MWCWVKPIKSINSAVSMNPRPLPLVRQSGQHSPNQFSKRENHLSRMVEKPFNFSSVTEFLQPVPQGKVDPAQLNCVPVMEVFPFLMVADRWQWISWSMRHEGRSSGLPQKALLSLLRRKLGRDSIFLLLRIHMSCDTWIAMLSYKQEGIILRSKVALRLKDGESLHDVIIELLIVEGLELPYYQVSFICNNNFPLLFQPIWITVFSSLQPRSP